MLREIRIASKIENLHIVENLVDSISNELNINKDNYGKILVSTLEATNNAIVHGNKEDIKKIVVIKILFAKNNLTIWVKDEGNGFRPEEIPDPTKPGNIETVNGRGVFLMSKLADEIKFNKKGNIVKMTFNKIVY